jgi:hypothetical protein
LKYSLNDGTFAHLHSIIQTSDYRRDYLQQPPNAVDEILRIAKMHLSPNCWRPAPLLMINADPDRIGELMRQRKLPPVMCVGEFVSYRKRSGKSDKAVFLHIVWLQEDLVPHISPNNEAALSQIDWEKYK